MTRTRPRMLLLAGPVTALLALATAGCGGGSPEQAALDAGWQTLLSDEDLTEAELCDVYAETFGLEMVAGALVDEVGYASSDVEVDDDEALAYVEDRC